MKYYLHRISHHWRWSYPLLEKKGLLSIGWAAFGARPNFIAEHHDDWSKVPQTIEIEKEYGKNRSRFGLKRFLEMEPGDCVLIPTSRAFHVYEVCDDGRLTPGQIRSSVTDLTSLHPQGKRAEIRDGYLCERSDNATHGRTIDLGFFRRVRALGRDIPRRGYADAALTSRMKVRLTNVDVTDLKESIEAAIAAYHDKTPINAYQIVMDDCQESVRTTIQQKLNPALFEKLIHSYFRHLGAKAHIPPKNERDKEGDADIVATFEPLNVTVYIQAKHHTGVTDEWGLKQIKSYVMNKDQKTPHEGSTWLPWVVSSGRFSEDVRKEGAEGRCSAH